MFLMFTSDLHPAPEHSASSRFLCAIIPASRYVLSGDGTNLTMQAACWGNYAKLQQALERGSGFERLAFNGRRTCALTAI